VKLGVKIVPQRAHHICASWFRTFKNRNMATVRTFELGTTACGPENFVQPRYRETWTKVIIKV